MSYKWSTQWGTLTEEDRKELVAALPVLEKLAKVIDKKIDSSEKMQRHSEGYGDPCWPYKQADYIGSQRTLKEIKELITPSVKNT